jgi:membrane protein YdbS with pleckstrin-like domain
MAKKERLTEDLKYLTEVLRFTWLTLLAVGGGTVGLVLGDLNLYRRIAAGAGAVLMIVLIGIAVRLHQRIRARIESLEEI